MLYLLLHVGKHSRSEVNKNVKYQKFVLFKLFYTLTKYYIIYSRHVSEHLKPGSFTLKRDIN